MRWIEWGRRVGPAVLLLLALVGALSLVNGTLEDTLPKETATGDIGVLPDGRALRVLSIGMERVVADLFWIRTAYYLGDHEAEKAGFPAADRLAELVTDIDPEFQTVYVLMGSGLTVLQGNPQAAARLLEKGIQHIEYWKLHFVLGFTYFFELLDYPRAATQFARAAELPGGPAYLAPFAARLYNKAGDPETALTLIRARLAEEDDESVREALQKRLWDVWINRDLGRIERAIALYRKREGMAPTTVQELVDLGMLETLPLDPRGHGYSIEQGSASTELEYDELDVYLGSGAGAHLDSDRDAEEPEER